MVRMQIYELLDRFELLYEDINPDISNLRRVVIDKDLPSLFRILENFEDKELTENIRSAVCDLNPWAFYKIYDNEYAENFKKFILNKNIYSLFKVLNHLYPDKELIINDIKSLVITSFEPNDMIPSIFRLINKENIAEVKNIIMSDFSPKDMMHSLFRALNRMPTNLVKNIAVTTFQPEDMMHNLFKLLEIVEQNDAKNIALTKYEPEDMMHSLFRIVDKAENKNDVKNMALVKFEPNDIMYALFRLLDESPVELYNDIKLITMEEDVLNDDNIQPFFRILQYFINDELIDNFRRAVTGETFSTKMRPLFSTFKDDKFLRNYYTATNREHASGQARLNATFNVIATLMENNTVVTDLRAIVAHDNRPAMYNCLDYVLDSDLVRILERFEKEKPEYNLHDAFTQGQLRSKLWLLKHLRDIDLGTVFICAGWYGTLARAMFENDRIHFDKIRSFDIDPKCTEVADMINKQWNKEDWKFKALHSDILDVNYTEHSWTFWSIKNDRESHPLTDSPNTIINTSCEHIEKFTDWFNLIPKSKLVALQSNNYFEIKDHINCVNSLDEFKQQAPLNNIIYEGELELEKYTRYMIIGYK